MAPNFNLGKYSHQDRQNCQLLQAYQKQVGLQHKVFHQLPIPLLHLKSESWTSLLGISEHFFWTQNEHPLQKIEFILTPLLHIAQGYLPKVCNVWRFLPEVITLVLFMFIFNPFDSRPFFDTAIFVIRPSNISAKITRSFA